MGEQLKLLEFSVHSVTSGIDALGEVTVRIHDDAPDARENPQRAAGGRVIYGHAADTDIVVASAKAYLAAINRLVATRGRPLDAPRRSGTHEAVSTDASMATTRRERAGSA